MRWWDVVSWVFLFLLMTAACHDGYAAQKKGNLDSGRQGQLTSFGAEREADFAILHEGLKRKYRVHLPPAYDGSTKTPVVIYLHGAGDNIRSASREGLDKHSDKFGFILVSPEGTKGEKGLLGTLWNGGKWKGGQCCTTADDVGFISKMIEALKQNFAVDEQRIYATGISNGGLLCNRLACELADKIAAVAVVASMAVPENCRPSRPISVMIIYGTEDPANPLDGSPPGRFFANRDYERMQPKEVLNSWLQINSCSPGSMRTSKRGGVTFTTYEGKNGVEVMFCLVEKMGHTWPGGTEFLLTKGVVGKVSQELSMEDVWAFFQKHPRK